MSLQGTLDTFALTDVLQLLAGTTKTGLVRVTGPRGHGEVWLEDGRVVGAEVDRLTAGAATVEVVFELLRFGDGDFVFDADMTTSDAEAPIEVAPLLAEAGALLAEWQEIEAVVPSLDAWVDFAPELEDDEVVVTADQWRLLTAIGAGATVGGLGDRFTLSELEVSRAVKDLVEAGLAVVGGEEVPPVVEVEAEPAPKVKRSKRPAAPAPVDDDPIEGLAALAESSAGSVAPELARQLASLGPEAARAVAAAAQAETPEEREAALAVLDGEDGEPVNRGLLLKFLSTVRS